MSHFLSQEDIQKIKLQYEAGENVFRIAARWEIHHTTVYYWAGRRKNSREHLPKRQKKIIKNYQYYLLHKASLNTR